MKYKHLSVSYPTQPIIIDIKYRIYIGSRIEFLLTNILGLALTPFEPLLSKLFLTVAPTSHQKSQYNDPTIGNVCYQK